MGRRLRGIVGALKDKVSISKASLTCASSAAPATIPSTTTTSPQLAVLHATTHHPSPPQPHHTAAILAFGRGSRLAASALVDALTARLSASRNPTVALKALLAAHHAARGSFILRDQLSAALRPSAASHRGNPLNLAAFCDAFSAAAWALSDWVRWYARVLEALLANHVTCQTDSPERATSLLDHHLIAELAILVDFLVVVARSPAAAGAEGNRVVWEAVRLVEEERLTAERGIVIRLKEVKERLGSLGFADSVELVCKLHRLGECRHRTMDGLWQASSGKRFWSEIDDVAKKVEKVVVKEERGRRASRERMGESARISDRILLRSMEQVTFRSSRWEVIKL